MTTSRSRKAATTTTATIDSLPRYDLDTVAENENLGDISKGGVACPFPWRLHACLDAMEDEGLLHVISWQPHGKAFLVHQPKKFVELVLPRFFNQTKYPSFQRQLNIYGFSRFVHGGDKGAYYHPCFVRGQRPLVRNMVRQKIKGSNNNTRKNLVARGELQEPNFYETQQRPQKANFCELPRQLPKPCVVRVDVPNAIQSVPAPVVSPSASTATVSVGSAAGCDVPLLGAMAPSAVVEAKQSPSLDLSNVSSWTLDDDLTENDNGLAFFEGSPFHLLLDDALPPHKQEPCCSCACQCHPHVYSL